ncbi:hypothetical protein [Erythrobacter sp. F6033]|uniref:hypothetical protein n=1 Tax=Erythrobacter sp. F6033 TaxID=2926401 RepID=UPI001FF2CE05|nr:hypothetical protein [Erythrobacter sp. F6033]MCK0128630.1 hypothetical protein [Erythrobacter sp. F6033]
MGRYIAFLLPASCLLAACGGGSSSAPPPTSTPAPSPSPSPTPVPTYTAFADQTGAQSYVSSCAGYDTNVTPAVTIAASAFGDGLSFDLAADKETWTITGSGLNAMFGPTPTADSDDNETIYVRQIAQGPQVFILRSPSLNGLTVEFARAGSVAVRTTGDIEFSCVFGVPTQTNDTFPTSVGASDVDVTGFARIIGGADAGPYDLSSSTASLAGNPNGGDLTLSLTLAGSRDTGIPMPPQSPVDFGSFSGNGPVTISATNFGGNLSSNDLSGVTANFGGWFFGPQAIETGISFSAEGIRTDGSRIVIHGTVIAR